jgi:hypothetical protein
VLIPATFQSPPRSLYAARDLAEQIGLQRVSRVDDVVLGLLLLQGRSERVADLAIGPLERRQIVGLPDGDAEAPSTVARMRLPVEVVQLRVAESAGQILGAIAIGIGGRERPAGTRPHAVVASLDAGVALDQIENAPPLRQEVVLDLDVEDVVPLGEIEVV